MTDYTQNTFFATKDSLPQGTDAKKARGSEIDAELSEIAAAIASKADEADVVLTANFTTVADAWLAADTTMVGQIRDLNDPGADRIMFWDDSEGAVKFLAIDSSMAIVGQTLSALGVGGGGGSYAPEQVVDHTTISVTAGSGLAGGGTIDGSITLNVGAGDGIAVNADDVEVDFTNLTSLGDPIAPDDVGALYDTSAAAMRKVAYANVGLPVETVAGTTKTLDSNDANTVQYCTSASATAISLNTSVGAVGNIIVVVQAGAGQVTIGGTATVNAATGKKTRAQHSVMILLCVAANTWVAYGDTSA